MSYNHTYTQKPRYNSVERHEQHNAEKIGLSLLLTFGLALIAILCNFFFEFLDTYKSDLNTALYWVAMSVIIAIGSCLLFTAIYYGSILWLNFEMKRTKTAHFKEKLKTETINNRLADSTQRQMEQGLVYLSEQETEYGKVKFKSLPSRSLIQEKTSKYQHLSEPKLEKTIKNDLIEDISNQQRLLLVGGQGSGKTTLLQHIAQQRSKRGLILVLDSHSTPNKWDSRYKVVGNGRDYKAIQLELETLVKLMDSRYKDLASGKVGERKHELITVISDEWTTLAKNLKHLDKLLLPLLTESRKVGIDFILATHSETAQSLGIKGMYDLKDNFDSILRLKNIKGERLVDVADGLDLTTYYHAGNFNQPVINNNENNKLDSILDKTLIKDQGIVDTYEQLKASGEFTWNKFTLAIYNKKGGHYVNQLKAVLNAHEIAYS